MLKSFLLLVFMLISYTAYAELTIMTSTTSLQMIAKEVGGKEVTVKSLTPPDRDTHYIQARPSIIHALRSADIVMAVGADLEIGWLPLAIQSSTNPKIQPGQTGYFEAANYVKLLESSKPADRSQGDVHPAGNPHFTLDPGRIPIIAKALAKRLGEIDTERKTYYDKNAQNIAEKITPRIEKWQSQRQSSRLDGVITYHSNALYLLDRFNIKRLGSIEPLPGIPPTAKHIANLVKANKNKKGVIIRSPYHQAGSTNRLAKALEWQSHVLPSEPPLNSSLNDYLKFIDEWLKVLVAN
ncbi:MAG: zinc ABC transporter substrate-binding protein [Pseudomonadota bacterium]